MSEQVCCHRRQTCESNGKAQQECGSIYAITNQMTRQLLALSAVLISIAGSPSISAAGPQAAGDVASEAAVIQQFHDRIEQYMVIRSRLANEVASPSANSSAVQVTNASDALAAAIQRARPRSQSGSFFAPSTITVFKRRVTEVVREDNLLLVLADIDDDGPAQRAPTVYLRFPTYSPLATMPGSLLAVLPPLPKELEYRIVGSYLVLRDIDAAIILDYIPAAVPR